MKFKLLAAVAALLALPLAANAQAPGANYPLGPAGLGLSATVVCRNQPIIVFGHGFAANVPVTVTFESVPVVIQVVNSDQFGDFRTSVAIPSDATIGPHVVKARATAALPATGIRELAATVTVAPTCPAVVGGGVGSGGGALATTGSSVTGPLTGLSVGLGLVGATLVAIVRRRTVSRAS